jgi:hypothetical protein
MASTAPQGSSDQAHTPSLEKLSREEEWITAVLAGADDYVNDCSNRHPEFSSAMLLCQKRLMVDNEIRDALEKILFTRVQARYMVQLDVYIKAGMSTNYAPASSSTLYSPLETHDVRLFTILSNDGEYITCRLQTYPCWLAPDYDALSYCWGDAEETAWIICNDVKLEIRQKLRAALQYLLEGHPAPIRPLWIDAVCLNQDDNVEKATQVPRMGEIYKAATRTLAWLGEDLEDNGMALTFLEWLSEVKDKDDESLSALHWDGFKAQASAFRRLVKRRWFFRVWISQEVALSQSIIMMYGHRSFQWSSFVASMPETNRLAHLAWTPSRNGGLIYFPGMNIISMEQMRSSYRRIGHVPVCFLMRNSEDRECREPIDRAWALLGVMNEDLRQRLERSGAILHDTENKQHYWRPYLAVMKLLFGLSRNDFWLTVTKCVGLAKLSHLPSWCPDWSASRIFGEFIGENWAGHPDATTRILPELSIPVETDWLSVTGFAIDTVRALTTSLTSFTENQYDSEAARMRSWTWLRECCILAGEVVTSPDRAFTALYQTLGCGSGRLDDTWSSSNLFQPVSQTFSVWSGSTDGIDVVMWSEQLSGILRLRTHGRRFFTTAGGRVGLGTREMELGDNVVVFHGVTVLYILRKVDRISKSNLSRLQATDLGDEDDKFEMRMFTV